MKLNVNDINKFMEVIHNCKGDVFLTDHMGGKEFKLNLKSELSLYMGIGKLLDDCGDWLELYVTDKSDESRLMQFIIETE